MCAEDGGGDGGGDVAWGKGADGLLDTVIEAAASFVLREKHAAIISTH